MQKKRRSVPISSSTSSSQTEFLEGEPEEDSPAIVENIIVEKMQRSSFNNNYTDKTIDIDGSSALLENASNWRKKMALAMTSSSSISSTTDSTSTADDIQGHQTKTIISGGGGDSTNDIDNMSKNLERGEFWGGGGRGGGGKGSDKNKTAVISLHYPYYPFGSSLVSSPSPSSITASNTHVRRNEKNCKNNRLDWNKTARKIGGGGDEQDKNDQGQRRPTSGFGGGGGEAEANSGINRNGGLLNGELVGEEERSRKCDEKNGEQKQLFYCKQVGWDPVLKKFHIQMDTMINKPKERDNVRKKEV